jgi:hypothetical protein
MIEIFDDIWNYHEQGNIIVITTNGTIKDNGSAVMGRGMALDANKKYPGIKHRLGKNLKTCGNHVFGYWDLKLITFPVKYNWWEKADLLLIERSTIELVQLVKNIKTQNIYMTRPGCANGKLDWKDVKPILEKYLDNKFIIVEKR